MPMRLDGHDQALERRLAFTLARSRGRSRRARAAHGRKILHRQLLDAGVALRARNSARRRWRPSIAAVAGDKRRRSMAEAADVLYHLLVLLRAAASRSTT